MPESFELREVLFGLFGGLAIFIYSMNFMGDGLKKAAGEKMRKIIKVLTGNPLMGILIGAAVTTIIQSSSATTVMVVGFVSARLMTLPQAIGVIMGANIGTTMTAQIIAFKIENYAYPIAAVGFIFYFFFKNKKIKYFGQVVFSLGLLFIGLNTMGSAMKPLTNVPAFTNMIIKLSHNPILGLAVGTFMTVIIQSSSATIGLLQTVAEQPIAPGSTEALINLKAAIPILLGDNIGTTITAFFASIGARINAKRAALAHTVFNLVGAVIIICFIPFFVRIVEIISPKGPEIFTIKRQIANAHTSFNLINTILWIPFIGVLAKIVTFIYPGKDEGIEQKTIYLDNNVLKNPSVAMDLATKELTRMAEFARGMMSGAREAFVNENLKETEKVAEAEDVVDMLQDEIIKYLSTILSSGSLTERQSKRLAGLMHVTGDIERVGDHCKNIVEFAQIRKNDNIPFSDEAIEEISEAFAIVNTMVDNSIIALSENNYNLAQSVLSMEDKMDDLEESLRNRHIKRLNKKMCDPQSAIIFTELIHNLERIADHCNNIVEAVLDDKRKL